MLECNKQLNIKNNKIIVKILKIKFVDKKRRPKSTEKNKVQSEIKPKIEDKFTHHVLSPAFMVTFLREEFDW